MLSNRLHINPTAGIKNLMLCIALCLGTGLAFAQQPAQLYKEAATLYKANQFDQAAKDYEKIISQGYKTAEVYYNLGNCYYKLNATDKTILNYERALKLSPQDEDIQHNLALANTRIIDKIQPVPTLSLFKTIDSVVSLQSSRGWAYMAIGFVWLALVFFAVYIFTSFRRFTFMLGGLFFILSVSFVSLAAKQNNTEQQSDAAILMVSNTFVKSAPDANGTDIFMLHEGVKFRIIDRVGDWAKIRLADGKTGWLERGNYEKI